MGKGGENGSTDSLRKWDGIAGGRGKESRGGEKLRTKGRHVSSGKVNSVH